MVADRARDEHLVARPDQRRGQRRRPRRPGRRPVVTTYIPSHLPRSTTLVSPVTTETPAASRGRRPWRRSRPPARRRAAPPRAPAPPDSASGRAPETARSLTVPLTASSPIDPPGKRIGRTTKASVVIASRVVPTVSSPASESCVERRVGEQRDDQALDERAAGLAAGAVRHRDPLVAEPLRAPPHLLDAVLDLVLGDVGSTRPRDRSRHRSTSRVSRCLRTGRSCSTPRRRPRRTPCRCRSGSPACRRCRRPCTPTA